MRNRRFSVLCVSTLALLAAAVAARADAYVYWTNGSSIGRANLDGSGANPTFITAPTAWGVAVDGAHIYWANNASGTISEGIGRANLDGSAVDQSFIAAASPTGVAVDGAHIYWTNLDADTIGRANLDGSGVDESFIMGADAPFGVAVGGGHIYWANFGLALSIGRADLDGSGVDQGFLDFVPLPRGLADDGAHIYWTQMSNPVRQTGSIGRANLDGSGRLDQFISEDDTNAFPEGLAVGAAHIYWTQGEFGGNAIRCANLDGSGVSTLISGAAASGARGLAVDGLSSPSAGQPCPPPPAPAPPPPPPDNSFSFGKLKRNTGKGTAKLRVKVPGPGEVLLGKTRRVRRDTDEVPGARKVWLKVRPRPKAKEKLADRGKLKVSAHVTYTPTGGEPNTKSKKVKLKRR